MGTLTLSPSGNLNVIRDAGASDEAWGVLRAGAGNLSYAGVGFQLFSSSTANKWHRLERQILRFSLPASLPPNPTAYLKFDPSARNDSLGVSPNVAFSNCSPGATLETADYSTFGSTLLADTIDFADWDPALSEVTTPLTTDGLALLVPSTNFDVMMRCHYDVSVIEPTWSSGKFSSMYFNSGSAYLIIIGGVDPTARRLMAVGIL